MVNINKQSDEFKEKMRWVIEVVLRYAEDKNESRFYLPNSELENKERKITFKESVDIINKIEKEKNGLIKIILHERPFGPVKSLITELVFPGDAERTYKLKEEEHEKKFKDNLEIKVESVKKMRSFLDTLPIKKYNPAEKDSALEEKTFEIKVKDREIWVNNYLLSKPHATSSNYEFLEYILSKSDNAKIERKNLPDSSGEASLKYKLRGDKFKKAFTSLGFKGEILKAFFKNRGKNQTTFRGKKITRKDLEDAGVKISLFIQELKLANTKNSSK
jgi:hypothetical protein